MCLADQQFTVALPLFFGVRTVYKEDLQASAADIFYGEALRVIGEVIVPAAPKFKA